MSCCCDSKKSSKVALGISLAVLIFSTGMIISFHSIYDGVLKTYITLEKGSLVTKIWEDIPLPIYEKLYFFNITNKEAFLEGTETLNVTEVGPYTFVSKWIKKHPQWHSNHTVSYREVRTYQFVPEQSNGTEEDIIYTLNGPMIIGANAVPSYARGAFSWYCSLLDEEVVTSKSIRELAYQGYEDPIIKQARIFKPKLPYKDGKFSWLYGKNASDDGLFTVFTGTDDESKTNLINNWNGNEKLSYWGGDTCNMLNGTSIETGPPIKGHQDSYTFFQSIFCRSITFDYANDTSHYNIPSKRFKPTRNLLANSTENPDNECFEVNEEHASGILDISSCQFGAPVFISFPHFHFADPSYLDLVNGLKPNEEKHGSYIDIEPITGVSIDLTVRLQINLEVSELASFSQFDKVTKGIFPIFWAELSLKIDENLANFLKRNVEMPKIIAYSVMGSLILISLLASIILIIFLYVSKTKDDDDPLIDVFESKVSTKAEDNDYNQHKGIMREEKINDREISIETDEPILFSYEDSRVCENESAVIKVECLAHK